MFHVTYDFAPEGWEPSHVGCGSALTISPVKSYTNCGTIYLLCKLSFHTFPDIINLHVKINKFEADS